MNEFNQLELTELKTSISIYSIFSIDLTFVRLIHSNFVIRSMNKCVTWPIMLMTERDLHYIFAVAPS